MKRLRPVLFALATGLAWLATGCQQYQWGTEAAQPDGELPRIAIAPVVNESGLPLTSPALTLRLEERVVQRPGRILTAPDADDADYVLEVRLVDARNEPRATLPEDTGRDLTYQLTLVAEVTWRQPRTREIVRQTFVDANSLLVSRQNLPDATLQAAPDALDELARVILDTYPLSWND